MNRKFALTLFSSPVLFASIVSMVMLTQPAQANEVIKQDSLTCMRSPAQPKFVCERRQNNTNVSAANQETVEIAPEKVNELHFTEEESDAAIALFGCDCPSCLNSLRQMRGMTQMAV
ncbi:hypothetical protein [Calothrix sp. UHCC 0171]|uniref:hypothetical protein n=1 Tax=Calothrix sp. UHCC 0171 TaxID=3110245 RepID=UPI002B1EB29A|nr:hypothetical protein [Calothrix sp. UHCC 0171]MEA5569855.1 hypothetical protein [Calothrix sp. UHCC 0171]